MFKVHCGFDTSFVISRAPGARVMLECDTEAVMESEWGVLVKCECNYDRVKLTENS